MFYSSTNSLGKFMQHMRKNMYWKEKKSAETRQSQIRAYMYSIETVLFVFI